MSTKNILLTCGESRTGDAIAHLLLERDEFKQHVGQLFVTYPPGLGNSDLVSAGAEILNMPTSDLSKADPNKLADMFKGADVAVIIPPAAKNKVDQAKKLMDACKLANVKNIVLLSGQACDAGTPRLGEFMQLEKMTEESMGEANYSILRAGHYMQNLFLYAKQMRDEHILGVPAGDGKFAPIDNRDVGLCAARVATSGEKSCIDRQFCKQTFTLTGPSLHTFKEIVNVANDHLGKAHGKSVEYKDVDMEEWRKFIIKEAPTMDISEVDLLGEGFDLIRNGKFEQHTDHVTKILPNEKPTTVDEFFKEHKKIFVNPDTEE